MSEQYEKIYALCTNSGISIAGLCNATGISKSAFTELKGGRTKSLGAKSLSKIAQYFNVSTDYLLSHEIVRPIEQGKGVKIPVVGVVHAGLPIEAIQDILDFEEITPELAASGEFMALRVSGDSMEPRICAGDVVIVRRQPTAENGDVCVVMVNGDEATLKKVQRTDDGIMLIPFNSNYAPMFFTNKQIEQLPVTILGKVIENRQKY